MIGKEVILMVKYIVFVVDFIGMFSNFICIIVLIVEISWVSRVMVEEYVELCVRLVGLEGRIGFIIRMFNVL